MLLCANHDALFDKGYISFNENGEIYISELLEKGSYSVLNINENISIKLNENQKKYMKYHREKILLGGIRNEL